MASDGAFRCEVERLPEDAKGNKVVKMQCHGRLIAENTMQIKDAVRPLLEAHGRIFLDLGAGAARDAAREEQRCRA